MSFRQELKRHNVFRVAILYLVASWLILQVANVSVSLLQKKVSGLFFSVEK